MSEDPIVVTGMGLVTPLGCGVDPVWEALLSGRSGIRANDRFETDDLPTRIAGLIPDHTENEFGLDPNSVVSVKDRKKIDLFTLYALAAAEEALTQANWSPATQTQKDRTATIIATGIGGFPAITQAVRTLDSKGPRRLSPFVVPQFLGNLAAGNISIRYGFRGPIGSPVTACAAGLQGVGDGMRIIANGEADVALVGGTEACVDRLAIGGFNAARALSTENDNPETASRPYDSTRSGFVLSEGAGLMVIEKLSHAKKRGATPLVILAGYGASADAYHLTAGPEDGSGHALAIGRALSHAGCKADQIGYINGHATSTPVGDSGEIAALRSIFGESLASTPISSTKSATGHLLGAAGSVAAIFSTLAVRTGKLPATLNFKSADAGNEDLDFIPDLGRTAKIDHALCNAFGFGGVNASLVVKAIDAP
ncbi:3-oxoacyl-[acyl-carrier-protein] synthase 2 [Pseudovibrio axinellae]|uniref:3-oxoacyl-[acyl-carrier-protein] synthase 2 n=1 Tax=Pseudovibrio axinellae TaxID=989403 RepID=A0A165Z5Q7_9HYPH|nr:beta-ketoacyl-ACP synthase II [Pseudovibrio axinellae]KZL19533.1 3-oxoacyl-[acyl-carrier-protein] synthase 2 [Pseudovibrio axinellae]SEQ30813.1 3-oxoacyl-[acyl-carrier-protein] synthase II [Pseudovibrio axinellae]